MSRDRGCGGRVRVAASTNRTPAPRVSEMHGGAGSWATAECHCADAAIIRGWCGVGDECDVLAVLAEWTVDADGRGWERPTRIVVACGMDEAVEVIPL